MQRPRAMAHVPGLDGLRGVAVIGVLMFHANARLRGGYLGVDLFFVLSGFLITTILVEEHRRTGAIDLRNFWIRRARRLMPALLSLMPAVALYAKVLAKPEELAALRGDALATIGYVANWRAILVRRSYWDMFLAPSPLEHTWSLAIEEQFYVVWPLVVVAILALARGGRPGRGPRAVFAASVLLALASVAAMVLLYEGGTTTRVYLGTDTRGAAILVGAALATSGLVRPAEPASSAHLRLLDVSAIAAAAYLGAAWWWLDGQSELLYRGGFWTTEVAALVLIASCVRSRNGLVTRALSIGPLRAMGAISYGVYLWHWPIYVVLTEERVGLGGWPLLAVRLALTVVVAGLSYRFLERPIRERGLVWGRPIVVVPAACGLAIALVLASTREVGARAPGPQEGALVFAPSPTSSAHAAAPDAAASLDAAPPGPPLKVLVVGDSVGIALGGRMGWDGKSDNIDVEQRAIGDCSILDGIVPVHSMAGYPHGNPNCAGSWVEDTRELHPDVTLVVIGGAYFSTVKVAGRWRKVCEAGWHDAYVKRLAALLDAIAPNTKRRVVLLAAYPVGKWQTPTLDDNVDCFNRILRDAAAASHAETIDLNPYLCPARACLVTSREAPVRPDGLHFDGPGAEDTARWVLAQLRAAVPAGADAGAHDE